MSKKEWCLFLTLLGGCAWQPRVISYPDGLKIVQVDQYTLDRVCSRKTDGGLPLKHAAGCYSKPFDMIYVRADCAGARSLTHEIAHRQGISDPSKDGFDW